MECSATPAAHDINFCSQADTVVHVGEVDASVTAANVRLVNLATGREETIEGTVDDSIVSFPLPSGLSPSQKYELKVMVDGPVDFLPYELNTTTGTTAIGTETVSAVVVKFIKVHDDEGAVSAGDQYVILK